MYKKNKYTTNNLTLNSQLFPNPCSYRENLRFLPARLWGHGYDWRMCPRLFSLSFQEKLQVQIQCCQNRIYVFFLIVILFKAINFAIFTPCAVVISLFLQVPVIGESRPVHEKQRPADVVLEGVLVGRKREKQFVKTTYVVTVVSLLQVLKCSNKKARANTQASSYCDMYSYCFTILVVLCRFPSPVVIRYTPAG